MNNVSTRLQEIINEFNKGGDHTLIVSSAAKKPMHTWMHADKSKGTSLTDLLLLNSPNANRVGVGFTAGKIHGYTLVDWDRIDEYNLETIRSILLEYGNDLIAYATQNGMHMWFRTPEEVVNLPKWGKRQQAMTTFVGNQKIDFLPNGIANMAMKSSKTGLFELFMDYENFAEGEICQPVVDIIKEVDFESADFTLSNINDLPELPYYLYPLGPTKETYLELDGSRNQGLTSWVNKLNFYTPIWEKDYQREIIEDCKAFINTTYLKDNPLSESEYNAITLYDNEESNHTNILYMDAAAVKTKKAAVKQGKSYNKQYTADFGEIAAVKKTDLNDIVSWIINNLEIKLYDKAILFMAYDKWQANPNILLHTINTLKTADHLTTGQLNEIYKKTTMELESRIAAGETHWEAKLNKRPLWVDRKGNQIDPYDVVENGQLKIQKGLENGIVLHNLNIDFEEINKMVTNVAYKKLTYAEEMDQYHRYLEKPLREDKARIDHLLSFLGYFTMVGAKFTKKMLMVYSKEANSGKSKLLEMIGSFYASHFVSRAKLHDMTGDFGLQGLMNMAVNIGDDIDGNMKVATDKIKTVASEMFAMAQVKGLPPTNAYMPKLAFSMNELPNAKKIDQGWLERMEIIHWEKNYVEKDRLMEENIVKEKFRNLVFTKILERAVLGDMTKDYFWLNPYTDIMESYKAEQVDMNQEIFADIICKNKKSFSEKTMTEIIQMVYSQSPIFNVKQMHARKFNNAITELGFVKTHTRKGNIWVLQEEENELPS